MNKVLIIEKINKINFLYIILFSYFYNKIVIFDSNQLLNNFIPKNDKLEKLIKKFFFKKVLTLDNTKQENLTYFSNKLTLKMLKKIKFEKWNYLSEFRKIESNNLDKVYRKHVLSYSQSKSRLYLLIRYLIKKKYNCVLFESYKDIFKIKKKFRIDKNFSVINFAIFNDLFYFLKSFLKIFFCFMKFIFINKFKFDNQIENYDFGYQISNRGENESIFLKKLLNLKDKKTILIYSIWTISKNYSIEFNKYNLCSEKKNSINIVFFFKTIIKNFFQLIFRLNKFKGLEFFILTKILIDYYNLEIFCKKYQIKNFISRDDYWESHGLRTIVQNKYKLNHIGIQHSAFIKPYANSYICYDFYDTYLRYNKFNYSFYEKYSYSRKNLILGNFTYENLDNIEKFQKKNKNLFKEKYGNSINILIAPPPFFGNQFIDYEEYFLKLKFIHLLLEKFKNVNFFFSLRKDEKKNKEILFSNYNQLVKFKKKIYFNDEFSTQEILINSDIIVVNDTSTIATEVLSYDKKKILCVCNFRFFTKKFIPWFEVEKSFIKQNSDEIYNFIYKSIIDKKKIIAEQEKILIPELDLDKKNIIDNFIKQINLTYL